jgi:hypothetical protein
MKKTAIFIFAIMSAGIFFSGCSNAASGGATTTTPSVNDAGQSTQQTQKVGTTTKTGKILQLENKFYIQESGKQPSEIDTYSLDLSQYVGQTITASGEYSGDTLFVTKISP